MNRRTFLSTGAGLGAFAMLPGDGVELQGVITSDAKLTPPAKGSINVAFLVSRSSNVIDMAGPWEVFQDVHIQSRGATHEEMMPFRLYTVAATKDAVRLTGGLHVIPDYSIDDAPAPHVVVVPAMAGSAGVHEWLRRVSEKTDLTMSVCTGAFQLARGTAQGKGGHDAPRLLRRVREGLP
jgi:putative intracellular protease/amidase